MSRLTDEAAKELFDQIKANLIGEGMKGTYTMVHKLVGELAHMIENERAKVAELAERSPVRQELKYSSRDELFAYIDHLQKSDKLRFEMIMLRGQEIATLKAKLARVEKVIVDLDTQCTNGHVVKTLRKALADVKEQKP